MTCTICASITSSVKGIPTEKHEKSVLITKVCLDKLAFSISLLKSNVSAVVSHSRYCAVGHPEDSKASGPFMSTPMRKGFFVSLSLMPR